MLIRETNLCDLVELEKNNRIPNLYSGPYRLIRSLEHDGKFIGSFWSRLTTEVTLILVEDLSKLTIARAMNEMNDFLYEKIPSELGISDSFVIFEGPYEDSYVHFLKKNFKMEEMQKALRIRRNDGA
jgi:hypothetical protein